MADKEDYPYHPDNIADEAARQRALDEQRNDQRASNEYDARRAAGGSKKDDGCSLAIIFLVGSSVFLVYSLGKIVTQIMG